MRLGALFLAGFFCACAGARPLPPSRAERKVVEAEGWAEPDASGRSGARTRALADGLRRALESAAGLELSARTKVSAGVAVEQTLSSRSAGVIERYEILSETFEGGAMKVRLKAVVLLGGEGSKPSVRVRLPDEAGEGVRRALAERGFRVLEGPEEADWVVEGRSTVAALAMSLVPGLTPWRARVSLQATRRGTGTVLQASREASALDAAPTLARAKALDLAGFLSGESLVLIWGQTPN